MTGVFFFQEKSAQLLGKDPKNALPQNVNHDYSKNSRFGYVKYDFETDDISKKNVFQKRCKGVVNYCELSKVLDDFCSSVRAFCYIDYISNGWQAIDQDLSDEDLFLLPNTEFNILLKIISVLKKHSIIIEELELNKNQLLRCLNAFSKSSLERKVEICKTKVLVSLLNQLKSFDNSIKETIYYKAKNYNSFMALKIARSDDGLIRVFVFKPGDFDWTEVKTIDEKTLNIFANKLKKIGVFDWPSEIGFRDRYDINEYGWEYVQCGGKLQPKFIRCYPNFYPEDDYIKFIDFERVLKDIIK